MIPGITGKGFLSYTLLPGLRPRLRDLFMTGFQHIPFLMALVYQAVRLLPARHPYTNPANIGRFGIRHVVAAAADNLVFKKGNADQIILFGAILLGLALAALQMGLLAVSLVFQPALAAMPTTFSGFFIIPSTAAPQDLSYIFLDMVFGIPGLFESCVDPDVGILCLDSDGAPIQRTDGAWILASLGWPFPIHEAMHQLFQLYSIGLLIVAGIITAYFVVTILAETAETGTAFGRRFNKVWAPLRFVMAIGLLIPVGYGLNSAQYIVLYAAKFGAGFATNGWVMFNEMLTGTYAGNVEKLVSQPGIPEVGGLLQFMYVARTCAELHMLENPGPGVPQIEAYLVKDPLSSPNSILLTDDGASPRYLSYEDMVRFLDGSKQAIVRFGIKSEENFPYSKGNVAPICGEIVLPLNDPRMPGSANTPEPGPEIMQRYYWFAINELWLRTFRGLVPLPSDYTPPLILSDYPFNYPLNTARNKSQWDHDPNALLPEPQYKTALQDFYSRDIEAAMLYPHRAGLNPYLGGDGSLEAQESSASREVSTALRQKGWAAAGIWYNKIAEYNGVLTAAVLGIPMPSRYPEIMEYVLQRKKYQNQHIDVDKRYKPELAEGDDVLFKDPAHAQMAGALYAAFSYWQSGGHTSTTHTATTGNAFTDMITVIFGTEGLYSMRRNPDIHPLAQLVGVGRALVESAVRNLGFAAGGGVAGHAFSGTIFGSAGKVAANFAVTIAMIALTCGYVMYYIIPFLPFIYFFFAVSGWIKGVFEAMVGAPLWALAHIRIDGEGLPGRAALSGYFLIFEIFLRPILIIFGLLSSISIFAALVYVLNQIWELVSMNLSGYDVRAEVTGMDSEGSPVPSMGDYFRNAIDQFFFTVIYAILVYMMGMASFKLVDRIPSQIMRWLGQSIKGFTGQSEEPAQALVKTAGVGVHSALTQMGGTLKGLLPK